MDLHVLLPLVLRREVGDGRPAARHGARDEGGEGGGLGHEAGRAHEHREGVVVVQQTRALPGGV